MSKDEKVACAEYKIIKGLGIAIFGLVWAYFASISVDVWSALPLTIGVVGVLLLLYGLFQKFS
jgi:hypothetical protein